MRSETGKDNLSASSPARNWKVALAFLFFSSYVSVLCWRDLRQALPSQRSILALIINGYVALILAWVIPEFRGFRERLVLLTAICNFIYRTILEIAPRQFSPIAPALRLVFLVAWVAAALVSLSLLTSALKLRGRHVGRKRGEGKGS